MDATKCVWTLQVFGARDKLTEGLDAATGARTEKSIKKKTKNWLLGVKGDRCCDCLLPRASVLVTSRARSPVPTIYPLIEIITQAVSGVFSLSLSV